MTRDDLLQKLYNINALPIRENEEEIVYQTLLANGDMTELIIFDDKFEIEYFSLVNPDVYNSSTLAVIKFDKI